jgi:hypothetical protein
MQTMGLGELLDQVRQYYLDRLIAAAEARSSKRTTVILWKPFRPGTLEAQTPGSVRSFCMRLVSRSGLSFPPAFVIDIGLIDDRGWAVVEFNPVWCSGLLGANPKNVLTVLDRACQDVRRLSHTDQQWVLKRSP